MKKVISIVLSMLICISILPSTAMALDRGILSQEVVTPYFSNNFRLFVNENWRYSISVGTENIVLAAVSNHDDNLVYQSIIPLNELDVQYSIHSDAFTISLLNEFMQNLNQTQKIRVVDTPATYGGTITDMKNLLISEEGRGYINQRVFAITYQGKNFEIMQTKDILSVKKDKDYCKTFQKGASLATICTFIAGKYSPTLTALSGAIGCLEALDTLIDMDINFETYYSAAVLSKATYTSGVNYEINYTSKANNYVFYNVPNNNESPTIEYQYTDYQHSGSYFDDNVQQVRDAYRNYFG